MSTRLSWSKTDIQFLHANFKEMTTRQLADRLGRSVSSVRAKCSKMGLRRDTRHIWTDAERQYLIENYPNKYATEIAAELNLGIHTVYNQAFILGLKCNKELLRQRLKGRHISPASEFKKGNVPANKGMKGIHLSPASEFKKGNLPHNTKHDGAISIRNHKGIPYKYIRVSLGKWLELHRVLWAEAHGPIPAGYCVRFINGDTLDCRVENLQLVKRAEHLDLNTDHRQSDSFIAGSLSHKDKALKAEIMKHPEIIELKRITNKLTKELKYAAK